MLLVGESINGTRKQVGEAITARDAEFIKSLAVEQDQAGAEVLDVNAGVAGGDEVADMVWLIETVRSVSGKRLMVDSASPDALKAGVEAALAGGGQVPFINSISGEQKRIDAALPMVEAHGCSVVGLCLSDEGVPPSAAERFEVARKMHDMVTAAGLPASELWVDPLVLTVSADSSAGVITMETLKLVKANLSVRTIGGLSNVSFGLPNRPLLNRTFVAMCMGLGIDGAVFDVRNKEMLATIKAGEALRGEDPYCGNYLKAHRAGLLG
jgi:5-methyltetrahydrofolate corrinoid/iron sulfur protein methyltransferase